MLRTGRLNTDTDRLHARRRQKIHCIVQCFDDSVIDSRKWQMMKRCLRHRPLLHSSRPRRYDSSSRQLMVQLLSQTNTANTFWRQDRPDLPCCHELMTRWASFFSIANRASEERLRPVVVSITTTAGNCVTFISAVTTKRLGKAQKLVPRQKMSPVQVP